MVKEVGEAGPEVLLLYASQTGNAQAIAEDLSEQLGGAGIRAELRCCSQRGAADALHQVSCLVLVASTTGDGDPPESAHKLWKQLRKWSGEPLSHLHYTVLGLGDTNYTNFCNFGKTVDKQLEVLGAQRFYRCGWADDGTGLEEVVEPWCEGLQAALKACLSMLPSTPSSSLGVPHLDTQSTEDGPHRGDSLQSVSRTDQNSEEPNNPQRCWKSVHEDSRTSNMAFTSQNEDVVSKIITHYNIDILPQCEVEYLPLRCCAFVQDHPLSLPSLPTPYLTLTHTKDCEESPLTSSQAAVPAAASEVVKAQVSKIRKLTHYSALKTTLEFTLELNDAEFHYHPGDSIGILVRNPPEEVELLLGLLGLSEIADKTCKLSITPGTKKRAAAVPNFLPLTSCLRHLFECCVDIRAVPKKPFLRALAEYTSEPSEKRRLLELVSKEGTGEYTCHVREAGLSTLDLLTFFKSCRPPATTLLEHLPRLLPRPYSTASSPLATPNQISFAFNVVQIPRGKYVAFSRQGVCTGWLASMSSSSSKDTEQNPSGPDDIKDVEQALDNLTLASPKDISLDIYLRTNQGFRPPTDPTIPVVMVGPGTGVAPFVGFLRHRQHSEVGSGEWWLFYGCRQKDKDFLYQEELHELMEEGVLTHLVVSYSREGDGPKYVQDNIIKHGAKLAPLMDKVIVYVCGDARNMAKEVFEAFVSVLIDHNKLTETEARKMIAKMQLDKRYLQDVWT